MTKRLSRQAARAYSEIAYFNSSHLYRLRFKATLSVSMTQFSSRPKRRLFQLHLSTAVVLMFAGGGLIWTNILRHPLYQNDSVTIYAEGWPCKFHTGMSVRDEPSNSPEQNNVANASAALKERYKSNDPAVVSAFDEVAFIDKDRNANIAIDVIVGVLLLIPIAFACEFWIRRRETDPLKDSRE